MAARRRIVVVGAGIAGLSCASEAAAHADVTVVEAELQPGYHSSGRSAALFLIPFVSRTVYALSLASETFFRNPPLGYGSVGADTSTLMTAAPRDVASVDDFMATWADECPWLERLSGKAVEAMVPILRQGLVAEAVLDRRAIALDVHALLEGHRRRLLERGGQLVAETRITRMVRSKRTGGWSLETDRGDALHADVVVNAGGAWADEVAQLAGVRPLQLTPKRRTAVLIDIGRDPSAWPLVHTSVEDLYFKAEAGLLMLSPADETDSPACDAQPEELDIAVTIDRFQNLTSVRVDRPVRSWAGLRTFAPDRAPLIGFDADQHGFFWLAGFGGYGVQTSPAYARLAAALLTGETVPANLAAVVPDVDPARAALRSE